MGTVGIGFGKKQNIIKIVTILKITAVIIQSDINL
jgi:hypothetical protein